VLFFSFLPSRRALPPPQIVYEKALLSSGRYRGFSDPTALSSAIKDLWCRSRLSASGLYFLTHEDPLSQASGFLPGRLRTGLFHFFCSFLFYFGVASSVSNFPFVPLKDATKPNSSLTSFPAKCALVALLVGRTKVSVSFCRVSLFVESFLKSKKFFLFPRTRHSPNRSI